MKKFVCYNLIFLVCYFCAALTLIAEDKVYRYLDKDSVLFGIEYTFQDEEMVKEPGRMTQGTPHKLKKMDAFFDHLGSKLGFNRKSIVEDTSKNGKKPGYKFTVPNDGVYVMNMEPVTIEVNTTPKKLDQIVHASTPIFEAANEVNLVPYVNPAAERSGMGHIHVGGATYG